MFAAMLPLTPSRCLVLLNAADQAESIAARRKSLELEVQQELETSEAAELAAIASSAATAALTTTDSSTPSGNDQHAVSLDAGGGSAGEAEPQENVSEKAGSEKGEGNVAAKSENDEAVDCDALAEEQRRLEESDKAEYDAEMARMKK